jgi:hypothetical protein
MLHHGVSLFIVNGTATVISFADIGNSVKYLGWAVAAAYSIWKFRVDYRREKLTREKELKEVKP